MTPEAYMREMSAINRQFYETQIKSHETRYNLIVQLLEKATGAMRLAPDKPADTEVTE